MVGARLWLHTRSRNEVACTQARTHARQVAGGNSFRTRTHRTSPDAHFDWNDSAASVAPDDSGSIDRRESRPRHAVAVAASGCPSLHAAMAVVVSVAVVAIARSEASNLASSRCRGGAFSHESLTGCSPPPMPPSPPRAAARRCVRIHSFAGWSLAMCSSSGASPKRKLRPACEIHSRNCERLTCVFAGDEAWGVDQRTANVFLLSSLRFGRRASERCSSAPRQRLRGGRSQQR